MTIGDVNKKVVALLRNLYFVMVALVSYALVIKDLNFEFAVKLIALLSLSFLYLETTKKVNYWYVLILLFSILSDSLFVFEDMFIHEALYLLIINRFLYIVIIKEHVFPQGIKKMVFYAAPFLLAFVMIYFLIYSYMKDIQLSAFIMGIVSVFLVLFTFLNFLNKNNKKSKYFFWGTFLMPFADVLTVIANYIDFSYAYVVIYHLMYYLARYLIYKSMVLEKRSAYRLKNI